MDEPQNWTDPAAEVIDQSSRNALPDDFAAASPRTPATWLAIGAAAVVVALVGVVLVGIGRGPSANAAGAVYDAAQKTLAQRSAAVTVTGTMNAAGRTIPLTGAGTVDFATSTMNLHLTMQMGGMSIVEHEVMVNGHLYLGMDIGGRDLSALTHGPHWLEMPVAQQSGQLTGGGDPAAQLRLLASRGNTVVSLGTSTIDGTKVTGYEVTPTRDAMKQSMQQMIAAMKLTPAERQQFEQMAAALHVDPPTMDAWFDSNGLLRKMRMKMSLSGAVSVTGAVNMRFTDYGTPVHVTAPRKSDVIDYVGFLRLLQSSGVKFP